jgi:trimeric autotransporter adhesin
MFIARRRAGFEVALIVFALATAGCGGGSSGSNPPPAPPPPTPTATLTVTPATITIAATTTDAAPTQLVQVHVDNPVNGVQYFYAASSTQNGVASVANANDGTPGDFTITFKSPVSLTAGTYSDTLTLKGCLDSACQQQVSNSPVTVSASYSVTPAANPTVRLTAVGPTTVDAGGGDFLLVVSGGNFDSSTIVQWNGTARNTFFGSSTELLAFISAADIASPGTVSITVTSLGNDVPISNALPFTIAAMGVAANMRVDTQAFGASFDTSLGGGAMVRNVAAVTIDGSTNSTYYYTIQFTGTAVSGLIATGVTSYQTGTTPAPGSSAGRITAPTGAVYKGTFVGPTLQLNEVDFLAAAILGAGTFSDTITISVCTDAQCTMQVPGSPVQIAATYAITGNPIPITQFDFEVPLFTVEAATSSTAMPTTTASISSNGLPPTGAYVMASAAGAVVAAVGFQSNLDGTGTVTVTLKPPSTLGSGIYSDSVQIQVCFDPVCSEPANHAQYTVPVRYIVDATAGTDFAMKTVANEITDMVWSEANQRIYAVSPNYAVNNPGSLLVINPMTASIDQVVPLGGIQPISIALSDDNQYAYIGMGSPNQVLRMQLASLAIDQTLALPASFAGLSIAPGSAHTVAVASYNNYTTLAVFDDMVQRPNTFSTGSLEIPLFFTWGADAATIYAFENSVSLGSVYQLSADTQGLTSILQTAGVDLVDTGVQGIKFSGGLLYSNTGGVFDPATNATLAPYPMLATEGGLTSSFSLAVDPVLSRVFATTDDQPLSNNGAPNSLTVQGFDLVSRKPTWLARFNSRQMEGPLIRWGNNGLAFETVGQTTQLVLISGSVIAR